MSLDRAMMLEIIVSPLVSLFHYSDRSIPVYRRKALSRSA
jgi:hypothetical protein